MNGLRWSRSGEGRRDFYGFVFERMREAICEIICRNLLSRNVLSSLVGMVIDEARGDFI